MQAGLKDTPLQVPKGFTCRHFAHNRKKNNSEGFLIKQTGGKRSLVSPGFYTSWGLPYARHFRVQPSSAVAGPE